MKKRELKLYRDTNSNILDYILGAVQIIPIQLHELLSPNIRAGIDAIFSPLPSEYQTTDAKKTAYYGLLSLTMSAACTVMHFNSVPLLSCMAIGAMLGGLLQGAPHCKDQQDIEKRHPNSAFIIGMLHGSTCALTNAAFFHALGSSPASVIASVTLHTGLMKKFMCSNERAALNKLDKYYRTEPTAVGSHCCNR